MFFSPRMAAPKCQYAKTHTRLEFAPHIASSSLFYLFTPAAVLRVSASLSKVRGDIIPVEHPAVRISKVLYLWARSR